MKDQPSPTGKTMPVFALKAGKVRFSLDLPTLLHGINTAEQEGCIPEISPAWWDTVREAVDTPPPPPLLPHAPILAYRASLGRVVAQDCDLCGYSLALRAEVEGQEIFLDLATLLKCLRVAEQEGYTPPLPHEWWLTAGNHFDILFDLYHKGVKTEWTSTSSHRGIAP